ncbi:MAG: hypothetical protein KAS35_01155 [Candidatus Marinimicrobia bacterium]|nr:hypothetical protein [Candidatus Neomarinimicrobiota bacterium]
MFYPLFFTKINRSTQNDKGVRHFLQLNYLLHLIAGCISVLLFWIYSVNYPLQLSGIVYLLVIVVVVLYYWKSPIPQWNLFGASIVFGVIVFIRSIREIVQLTPLWPGVFIGLLSTGIIAISTLLFVASIWKKFAKSVNLSIIPSILKTLILLLGIRIVWDLVILFNVQIGDQNGILMSVYQFFMQNDILYFLLTMLFGLIIPLIIAIVWMKKDKSFDTKKIFLLSFSLLIIIWFSEFFYKYFLLQYGVAI